MATIKGSLTEQELQALMRGDRGLRELMEMLVNGVSTRKVKRVTEELCGREFSKSTVSRLAKGVNEEGYREIVGLRIANSETEEGWLETFRWLKARGREGIELVVSDAHGGSPRRCTVAFRARPGRGCQTHFRRNILDKTPAEWKDAMQEGLDRVFEAEDPEAAREHFEDWPPSSRTPSRCSGCPRRPTTATDHQYAGAAHPGAQATGGGRPDLSWPRRTKTGRPADGTSGWRNTSDGTRSRPPRGRVSPRPEPCSSGQAGDGVPQVVELDR